VTLPPDIHPLPDSVTEYFVYPFTLEPHVVTLEQARRRTLAAHTARHEALLASRAEEKERRKRDALRRIAPGFEPQGAPLVPVRKSLDSSGAQQQHLKEVMDEMHKNTAGEMQMRDVMADLVDSLERMDTRPNI
jgi:hypothetical protein